MTTWVDNRQCVVTVLIVKMHVKWDVDRLNASATRVN